jgi:hypothetical protein
MENVSSEKLILVHDGYPRDSHTRVDRNLNTQKVIQPIVQNWTIITNDLA